MGWNLSAQGSKSEAVDAINKEHVRGQMTESHRAACVAEVDQCDADVLSISAQGRRDTTGGNISITVTKVS